MKTVSNIVHLSFYNCLNEFAIAPQPLFHSAGIHYEELTQPGLRIDAVRHFKLQDRIMPHMQEFVAMLRPNFAQFFNQHPSLAAACGNAENLREALNLFFKYRTLIGDCDSLIQTKQPGKQVSFIFTNERKQDLSTLGATFNFCIIASLIQHFQGEQSFAKQLSLTCQLGNNTKIVSDAFACPVFQGKRNTFTMPAAILDLQNPQSNSRLQPLLIEKLQSCVNNLVSAPKLSNKVRQILKTQLWQKNDSSKNSDLLEITCQALNMTRWTLNRRLQTENSNFSLLLKQFRREQACRLLLQSSHSITEISEQLGFINHSSFSRFFSEQFNQTPVKFRKKYAQG